VVEIRPATVSCASGGATPLMMLTPADARIRN